MGVVEAPGLFFDLCFVVAVAQWLRAARAHPDGRPCALRYAAGVAACQAGWLTLLAVPDDVRPAGFAILVLAELAVPVWAERSGATSWHPGHIAERYGLSTIIVLGESVLAASVAVQTALDTGGGSLGDLAAVAGGGLLIVFSMWWMYFDQPTDRVMERARRAFDAAPRLAFVWGYGHLAVFATAAAVGAGLAVSVDHATDHSELSDAGAGLALTPPVVLYLLVAVGPSRAPQAAGAAADGRRAHRHPRARLHLHPRTGAGPPGSSSPGWWRCRSPPVTAAEYSESAVPVPCWNGVGFHGPDRR